MSLQMMSSAAPLAAQKDEFAAVLDGATNQLGLTNFADFLKLVKLLTDNLPAIMAAVATIQEAVQKLVELWKSVNPTPPPAPNVP